MDERPHAGHFKRILRQRVSMIDRVFLITKANVHSTSTEGSHSTGNFTELAMKHK